MDAITRIKALLAELEAEAASPEVDSEIPGEAPPQTETAISSDGNTPEPESAETDTPTDGGTETIEPSIVEDVEVIAPPEPVDITIATPDNPEGGVNYRFGEQADRIKRLEDTMADLVFTVGKLSANFEEINTAIVTADSRPAPSLVSDIGAVVRKL